MVGSSPPGSGSIVCSLPSHSPLYSPLTVLELIYGPFNLNGDPQIAAPPLPPSPVVPLVFPPGLPPVSYTHLTLPTIYSV